MYSKFLIISLLVTVILVSFVAECKYIPNSDQIEVDDDPNNPPARRGPLARRFTAWMNFLKGFWNDGNWENGGPPDFASFIGEQVSKLVKSLDEDRKKKR